MNNQNPIATPQSKDWQSWLVLFLRWLLGSLVGFGISAWICYAYKTNTVTGPLIWLLDVLPILSIPFTGPLLLFDPSFFGKNNLIDVLVILFPKVDYDFLVVLPPSLLWGVIGALLVSGRKAQTNTGVILLVVYVIVGLITFFRMIMLIPT